MKELSDPRRSCFHPLFPGHLVTGRTTREWLYRGFGRQWDGHILECAGSTLLRVQRALTTQIDHLTLHRTEKAHVGSRPLSFDLRLQVTVMSALTDCTVSRYSSCGGR
jgi:hypothetical protein